MEKKDKHFIKKPVYPGGVQAMKKFIGENMVYPEKAKEAGVKGTVTVDYTISYQGKVIETKIVSGLGYGCDEEAIRLVKMLKFEVPRQRVRKIRFHKTINIHFRARQKKSSSAKDLKQEAEPTSMKVQYQLTSKPKKEEKDKKKNEGGYTYTVRF